MKDVPSAMDRTFVPEWSAHQSSPTGKRTSSLETAAQGYSSRLSDPLFEQADEAIALVNDRGCLVECNWAFGRLLGMPATALVGKTLAHLLPVPSERDMLKAIATAPLVGTLHLPEQDGVARVMSYTLIRKMLPHRHLFLLRDGQQEQAAIAAELQRQRQWNELFSEVTLKIRQSLHLKAILYTTVNEVQRILQADRVLIYQVLPDGMGKTISEAVLPGNLALIDRDFPAEVFPPEYQALYAEGRVRAIADVHDPAAGLADCLVAFVEQFGIKAKLIVPIVQSLQPSVHCPQVKQNQLWGLLIAHQCSQPRQWTEFELELMQQLADQISIALAQAQLLGHLEERVAERTAELQAVNLNLQREIHDRVQAEMALRQSEEQLRLITNALPVLIAYVDDQQRYRFNNQAYQGWLGQSPVSIYGCHGQQVWGEDAYRQMQPHIAAVLAGQMVSYERDIRLVDGSVRSVDVTYIPHVESPGVVKGFFDLTSDISDRKAIERMKDEFIAIVSHELRTPLTSLHSALKILATGKLGSLCPEGQQMLEIANDSTERLVRLVNNVLDLQRIESGAVVMDCQICNAAHLITQAVEVMTPMAQQQGITLVAHAQDLLIWADGDYILQALTNLISNAIKFSSSGRTVWLTVAVVGDRQPDAVIFRVRDEGQGIPTNQIERIFERFQQVDSSDARKKGGTGLGLTICRKIIEQHNGRIWAESTLGVGSTFSFTVPALNGCDVPV